MSKYKYSQKNLKENQARSVARDASVSVKTSVETVKFLKGKTTKRATAYLEKVLEKKIAIPYTRFTDGVGHRAGNGITSGRYPQKLSKVLINLIKNVEANASMKGLGEELKIVYFVAHKAATPMHYGRHPRREMKRTHVELIVEEVEAKKKTVVKKKVSIKAEAEEKKVVEKKTIETPVKKKAEVKVDVPKKEEVPKTEAKVEAKVEEKKTVEKPIENPKSKVKTEIPKDIKKEAIEVKK